MTGNKRLNQLMRNITPKNLKTAMLEFGDVNDSFFGKNENNEDVIVGISRDSVVITTYQSNGWVRKNYYNADGDFEGSSYDGRWDR